MGFGTSIKEPLGTKIQEDQVGLARRLDVDTIVQKFIDADNLVLKKLSNLYNAALLRYIEREYGSDILKELVLKKLRFIEDFDDCLVITDFTQFTETGTGSDLPGAGDSVTWTKTTDELICEITTDSTTGWRKAWMYVNFATEVKKFFVSTIFVAGEKLELIDVCDADASTYDNPPNWYFVDIYPPASTADFKIIKRVGGTSTVLAEEAVDLTAGTAYKVAFYVDVENGIQKAWREADPTDFNSPTLSATDTEITTIASWRFHVETDNTSVTETYKWKVPLIVAWKT